MGSRGPSGRILKTSTPPAFFLLFFIAFPPHRHTFDISLIKERTHITLLRRFLLPAALTSAVENASPTFATLHILLL